MRRLAFLAYLIVGALAFSAPSVEPMRRPLTLTVFGDSFTAALDPSTMKDEGSISWATGSGLPGPSIVQLLDSSGLEVLAVNRAHSGARMQDLPGQVVETTQHPDVVLIWLGINDLCAPDETAADFASDARVGFDAVARLRPARAVLVFGPPDLVAYDALHAGDANLTRLWLHPAHCRTFMDPEGNTTYAAEGRDRIAAFASVLSTQAADHGFVYSDRLSGAPVDGAAETGWDGLHPNPEGSARIAAKAWPVIQAHVR